MPDQLILGIDAAWTEKAPSGVALVQQSGERCSCLGLAPSYEAFLGLAQGQAVDWSARPAGGTPDAAQLLDAVRALAGTTPTVVCIDIPLSIDPISGRRRADERVSQVYGAPGALPIRPVRRVRARSATNFEWNSRHSATASHRIDQVLSKPGAIHLMSVTSNFSDIERADVDAIADRYGLRLQSRPIINEIREALDRWPQFADRAGVA